MKPKKSLTTGNTFVTYGGRYTIELQPVSPFSLDDARSVISIPVEPEVPNVEIPSDFEGGESTYVPLDEKFTQQHPDDQEIIKAWAEYQNDVSKYKLEAQLAEQNINLELLRICILEGCTVIPDEGWIKERRKRYKNVPDNKDADELKVYYMLREILRRPSDMAEFVKAVLELSELSPERLKQVEARFQPPMENGDKDDSTVQVDEEAVADRQD